MTLSAIIRYGISKQLNQNHFLLLNPFTKIKNEFGNKLTIIDLGKSLLGKSVKKPFAMATESIFSKRLTIVLRFASFRVFC